MGMEFCENFWFVPLMCPRWSVTDSWSFLVAVWSFSAILFAWIIIRVYQIIYIVLDILQCKNNHLTLLFNLVICVLVNCPATSSKRSDAIFSQKWRFEVSSCSSKRLGTVVQEMFHLVESSNTFVWINASCSTTRTI